MADTTNINETAYNPSAKERGILDETYKEVNEMVDERNKTYNEFNDRHLKSYLNDSLKRLNAYVPDRDSYDPPKEDWQSNVALQTVRNKVERIIAGFSLQVPDLEVKAYGENNQLDIKRGEVAKELIRGSYLQEENPVLSSYWEAFEAASKGTVVKYEGYLKTKQEQKHIKSYDIATGDIEYDEREVNIDDDCISFLVPLTEFYVRDYYIHNVQKQPRVAWIRYLDRDRFMHEFGKYPKAKKVPNTAKLSEDDTTTFFYKNQWNVATRAGKDKVEVVRYYDILNDVYRIVANGVVLLDTCLLWESNGRKVYPFAKSIFKPFTSKHFFYGNSMPNIMIGQYDIQNTVWNSILDKEFRNLEKPLLVGQANRDALELEDEFVSGDRKIYVNDVNQVVPLPQDSVNNADVNMLQMIAAGIEQSAPSLPDLMQKKKATAREVVIAEEKLREIKSAYHEMLVDLWRQKYYLRLANIQLNYPQQRQILTADGKEKTINRTFLIPNSVLEQDTGERGLLAVQFRDVKPSERRKIKQELSVEEQVMKSQGVNYKKVIAPRNYFDNYKMKIEVISESLHKTSLAKMQMTVMEKLEAIAKLFPQVFVANKKEYFQELAKAYEENPDVALSKMERTQKMMQGALGQGQGGGGGGKPVGAGAGMPALSALT